MSVTVDEQPLHAEKLGLRTVGQVTGEHDHLRRQLQTGEATERPPQVLLGVELVVHPPLGQQVRVAHVGDDMSGERVLTQWFHPTSLPLSRRRA